ncbi:glycoside hydrolase family 15 protein [Streptomyces sp. GC420]|uniref:glycoside hydrolase family 15 protein n=1 Tax=Streptomyces sp. GC420 TaxID=2697568 RepID=UPI001414CD01|nr:glycoside hydrolase family 15 protein [Streptomyces sp. GC420]NBM14933.1 glycoside hydrolase family 15 protein [Streptomyces sp. GC420]
MTALIEDHALVGDLHTAALIHRAGSVTWQSLPDFDSPAAFASLVGTSEHGSWDMCPTDPDAHVRRRYLPGTLVLETTWTTHDGQARVLDFMPTRAPGCGNPQLIRVVQGVHGVVQMSSRILIRFAYGKVVPRLVRHPHQFGGDRYAALAGPDALYLDSSIALSEHADGTVKAAFSVRAGERQVLALSWQPSHLPSPPRPDPAAALESTIAFWSDWSARSTYTGPYQEAVHRSLIVLKALTYAPTGGMVAAPTTSLPEEIRGERNWDYRYTWLRDAAIALSVLVLTGHLEEAAAWRDWLARAIAGDPATVQIMYSIKGGRDLPESTLPHLLGYEGSQPVRVGNGAAHQPQLDVFGEVLDAFHLAEEAGLAPCDDAFALQSALLAQVEARWHLPDAGIWEMRGPERHFVHSKIMGWVAADRMVRRIESGRATGPVEQWRKLRDAIHADVCARGYDPVRNTFTQSYGSAELDASLLLIPLVGFLPPDDKRVIGTIEAIQRELSTGDGLILRYRTAGAATGADGLAGDEGAFLACSFWLVEALTMIGRTAEATALFEKLLALTNDVGLLAEEYDCVARRQLGNFPQAFSHFALVSAALRLASTEQTAARDEALVLDTAAA